MEVIEEAVVLPVRDVVMILHAHDRGHGAGLIELLPGHVAEADVPDLPPLLQLRQGRQGRHARCSVGRGDPTDSQVDDRQYVQPEVAKIVLDGLTQ
jgi:hypothetical protein